MPATSKLDSIVDAIRNRILSNEFEGDGRLPSFRQLAAEYQTTQETMNKTIQALQAEGLLISKGAKGIFTNLSRIRLPGITPNLYDYLKKHVEDAVQSYVQPASVIEAPEDVAQAMKLSKKTLVLFRYKQQGTKDKIFRIEKSYYPKALLSDDLIEKAVNNVNFVPLIAIKKATGLFIKYGNEEVIVRLPTNEEQQLLKIVRTNPVIDVKRKTYTPDKKKVILYSQLVLDANHFQLVYDYEVTHWL